MSKRQTQPVPSQPSARNIAVLRPVPENLSSPALMIHEAVRQGKDIETLERLYALQQKYEADEARKAYVASMAEFKRNPPEILKRSQVSYRNKANQLVEYDHADLGQVCGAIVAELGKFGFSHNWVTKQEGTKIEVTCVMTHAQGHSERVTLFAPPDDSGSKNGIQAIASTVTYLQRYTLLSITGLATVGMDNDGRGGVDDVHGDGEGFVHQSREKRWDEMTAAEQEAAQKAAHDAAAAIHSESIAFIKDRIAADDLKAAAGEWNAIGEADQRRLWLATTKGGCFSTLERAIIKEKFHKFTVTPPEEGAADVPVAFDHNREQSQS